MGRIAANLIPYLILAAWCSPEASHGAEACPAPKILAPASNETITDIRPTIRWQPVTGAKHYRIELRSRQPEGAVLASIDTVVTGTVFVPPNPLAASTAAVTVAVTAVCENETAKASKPESTHRFYIDARPSCRLPELPTVQSGDGGRRIVWRKTANADRYEVFAYKAADGTLAFSRETREPNVVLPAQREGPLTIMVRPRCGPVMGAAAYVLD